MRGPDLDPVDPTSATGPAAGPAAVPGAHWGDPTTAVDPSPSHGVGDPGGPPTTHPTRRPRRVPLAVIAGVDWIRLAGRR